MDQVDQNNECSNTYHIDVNSNDNANVIYEICNDAVDVLYTIKFYIFDKFNTLTNKRYFQKYNIESKDLSEISTMNKK